jgi:starvation-inducible DNA-binding protein
MKTETLSPASEAVEKPVVAALNRVLADSYALMALSHQAHWNVEGSDFFQLHQAFQSHYENLFAAIDDIAERVRALNAYAPGGLRTLAEEARLEEPKGTLSARDYVTILAAAHAKTVNDLKSLRDTAGEHGDPETEDLAIGRIAWHQKTLWMLTSYLKA